MYILVKGDLSGNGKQYYQTITMKMKANLLTNTVIMKSTKIGWCQTSPLDIQNSCSQTDTFDLIFWCLTPLSTISWRPVLVVEEAGVPGENHRPWTSNW